MKNASTKEYEEIDSTMSSHIEFSLLNKNFISFTSFNSTYNAGAAHGYYGWAGHNYFLNPLRIFDLEDIIPFSKNNLLKLKDLIHEKLMIIAKTEYEEDYSNDFYLFDLVAKKENFENYHFIENSIVFIYNPYHLAAWSFGEQRPKITFDELKENFPNEEKLIDFLQIITPE